MPCFWRVVEELNRNHHHHHNLPTPLPLSLHSDVTEPDHQIWQLESLTLLSAAGQGRYMGGCVCVCGLLRCSVTLLWVHEKRLRSLLSAAAICSSALRYWLSACLNARLIKAQAGEGLKTSCGRFSGWEKSSCDFFSSQKKKKVPESVSFLKTCCFLPPVKPNSSAQLHILCQVQQEKTLMKKSLKNEENMHLNALINNRFQLSVNQL